MSFARLLPARGRAKAIDAQVVSDLDAIIARPVAFRWQGQTHVLEPIDVSMFLQVSEAIAKMEALMRKEGFDLSEAIDTYADVIGSVCKTIGRKELMQMTQAQVGALLQLVYGHVTGKVHADDKKKTIPSTQGSTPA